MWVPKIVMKYLEAISITRAATENPLVALTTRSGRRLFAEPPAYICSMQEYGRATNPRMSRAPEKFHDYEQPKPKTGPVIAVPVVKPFENAGFSRILSNTTLKRRKGSFDEEEDALLCGFVAVHGSKQWPRIAEIFHGARDAKQCRERWVNHLDPKIVKGDFSDLEDERLMQAHAQYGNKWSFVSNAVFAGKRTRNQLKNRFRTLMCRRNEFEVGDLCDIDDDMCDSYVFEDPDLNAMVHDAVINRMSIFDEMAALGPQLMAEVVVETPPSPNKFLDVNTAPSSTAPASTYPVRVEKRRRRAAEDGKAPKRNKEVEKEAAKEDREWFEPDPLACMESLSDKPAGEICIKEDARPEYVPGSRNLLFKTSLMGEGNRAFLGKRFALFNRAMKASCVDSQARQREHDASFVQTESTVQKKKTLVCQNRAATIAQMTDVRMISG